MTVTGGGMVTVTWTRGTSPYRTAELIFPLLCALIFACKDVTVRWGLGDGGGDPILAAGIAALTSTVEIFLIKRYFYGERFCFPTANAARWFVWSGIFTGGSFLCMYVALSMERVTIIAPLINSYAVFVLILTPLMARQIEIVTRRKVAGAAMVVAGIFMVSLGKN